MARAIVWLGLAGVILVGAAVGRMEARAPAPLTAPAKVEAQVRRRPAATPVIQVQGDVVGVAPGASGMLRVHVDGQLVRQVAATADGFAIEVPASTSGMITLEYVQPGIHFVSPLGSYASLVRMAGADGRLTRDDCECTRISAFSTALQHATETMLGRAARNDGEFRNAVRQAGGNLGSSATALVRLAADPTLLPPGHDTGLALLRDRPAFVEYLSSTYYTLLNDESAALDLIPAAEMDAAGLPERFALVGPLLDVGRPTPTTALVVEREGDAFRMHAPSGSLGVSYLGHADDDALVMVPDGEIALVNPYHRCPGTGQFTERHWKATGDVLQRQWASDGMEIWRRTSESEVSFPDCPELAGYVERWTQFMPAFDLADTGLLTDARRFLGERALPIFCSTAGQHNGVPMGDCGYAVHRFARDGSGEILDLGHKVDDDFQPIQAHGRLPFAWTMGTDGAMHVQAGEERTRYWVLDGGDRTALGVVHVSDAERETGYASLAGYSPMIRVGVTDIYDASTVPGAWGYATFDAITTPGIDSEASEVRILRDTSGRSVIWEDGYTSVVERWTTAWGRLYSTRYSRPTCLAPSSECRPEAVRYFRPLARVGDRIHGIEEMYSPGGTDIDGNVLPPAVYSRPQFHERREMPEGVEADGVTRQHTGHRTLPPAGSKRGGEQSAGLLRAD